MDHGFGPLDGSSRVAPGGIDDDAGGIAGAGDMEHALGQIPHLSRGIAEEMK